MSLASDNVDQLLAQRIAERRRSLKISKAEAAARIGISEPDYLLVESGKARIDAALLSRIALAFNQPIAWFFDQESSIVQFPLRPFVPSKRN